MTRLLLPLTFLIVIAAPAAAQAQSPDPEALELALRIPMERFDAIQFINAARGATTGVYEIYCGVDYLIPDPGTDGVQAGDVGLGIGCLVGATALLVMTGFRIAAMSDDSEGWDRLRRFRAARADGLTHEELHVFERELAEEASTSRLRRGFSIGLGVALVIASSIMIGLTAAGEIDGSAGTSIAVGTASMGLMSLIAAFVDTPAEAAERAFREALH